MKHQAKLILRLAAHFIPAMAFLAVLPLITDGKAQAQELYYASIEIIPDSAVTFAFLVTHPNDDTLEITYLRRNGKEGRVKTSKSGSISVDLLGNLLGLRQDVRDYIVSSLHDRM